MYADLLMTLIRRALLINFWKSGANTCTINEIERGKGGGGGGRNLVQPCIASHVVNK